MNKEQELLNALKEAVISGDIQSTEQLAKKANAEGLDPVLGLDEGLGKGISIVGDAFGKGEMFIPELISAGQAMQAGTNIFVEALKAKGVERKTNGKIVIGTPAGDIHTIGMTLVSTFLRLNGFEIISLGNDNPVETFVEAVRHHQPDILGISALLTVSMLGQRDILKALEEANIRSKVKVMVGGGPVTAEWADEIGADAYGVSAADAVIKAKSLMNIRH
jgi:corrinoid protein of di/trimethylamine methyltransferase